MKYSATLMLVSLIALSACTTVKTVVLGPPVAGMRHVALARIGEKVRFDASTSAVAHDPANAAAPGSVLTRFEFEVALPDGTTQVSQASPLFDRTFDVAGTFAVAVTVQDDRGIQSKTVSTIEIVADYTGVCNSTDASACPSGICVGDVCKTFACAAQPACPLPLDGTALTCDRGFCVVQAQAKSDDDAYSGEDVEKLHLGDTAK